MRTTASNSTGSPPSFSATTFTVFEVRPSLSPVTPEIEKVSVPSSRGYGRLALRELQRQHAHADEVGAVDALVALGDDGLHAQQAGALGCPVTRGPGAVLLAREDHQRIPASWQAADASRSSSAPRRRGSCG